MSADTLPDVPVYCFAPVEDAEVGVHQIRIIVGGVNAAIGMSLVALTED